MDSNKTNSPEEALLSVRDLVAGYGRNRVLHEVSLTVAPGEVVALIGANGAGKTTLMSTILGRISATSGEVRFKGEDIGRWSPQQRVRRGLALVPEGREPLKPLSVQDNLLVARARGAGKSDANEQLDQVYELFPRLKDRYKQQAGSMSGGEQQMLAIGRALMSKPDLLMLDEPSLGLAPTIVDAVFESLALLRASGLSMLLVEQDAFLALDFADRGYVLDTGSVTLEGAAKTLADDPTVKASYLGMG